QVDGVPAALRALLGVVERRQADDADVANLVLARSVDDVGLAAHHLGEAVVLMLVADRDQVGVLLREPQPDRGRIWVGYDRRVLATQPEAAVSKPGDVHSLYILSGAETPIKSKAVFKV